MAAVLIEIQVLDIVLPLAELTKTLTTLLILNHTRYNAFTNHTDQSNNAEMLPALSNISNAGICSIWEPRIVLRLERSIDLRCIAQKPFKARSLPKEMKYENTAVMSTNNEFLLLFGDGNLHLFDENLKLVKSTIKSPISSYNLVDITWCESIQRFIVLSTEEGYVFDPVTTRLSSIENLQLQENEGQYASCTCSNDKFFVVISKSYCYLHQYKLPGFTFICRLTAADLIGFDPKLGANEKEYTWSRSSPMEDAPHIVSLRYNRQRLGMMMELKGDTFFYAFDITQKPVGLGKTKLPWNDGQLSVLTKSGEWLVVHSGYDDKFIQITLDCQLKTEWEPKNNSQDSFFSFSTGFVSLKGNVTNAIMFGSSYLVLLLDDSLALYKV